MMSTFAKTIVILSSIALGLIAILALFEGNEGLAGTGILLILASPVVFLAGLITAVASAAQSKGRQIGQGMMMSALIYFLIGFGCCSGSNVRI